jgi:hypothetical protein
MQGNDVHENFVGRVFGTLTAEGLLQGLNGIRYQMRCSCGTVGQVCSQQELASGNVPVCRSSSHASQSAPIPERRSARFGNEDPYRGSVRARNEARAESEVLKGLEESETK